MAERKSPKSKNAPSVYLAFDVDKSIDYGNNVKIMRMRAMMNAGYVLHIEISDPGGGMFNQFIEKGYFDKSRTTPVEITFKFNSGMIPDSPVPDYATPFQKAIITSTEYKARRDDRVDITFKAVDPVSYYLNMGKAGGESYKGRIDEVIKQVIGKYAPKINIQMDKTKDSSINRFWMMRQDPKTFISSMLEWSTPLNQTKTTWVLQTDGYNLKINDQGSMTSKRRGFYARNDAFSDPIASVDVVANNALNLVSTKLISSGVDSNTGEIFDTKTDQKEVFTVAKDSTTTQKQVPMVEMDHSYNKPNDDPSSQPPITGATHVFPIPQYTAGDLGVEYRDYIDGRARDQYLRLLPSILKTHMTVKGHGEFINTIGLGVDTVFLDWHIITSPDVPNDDFWMYGNWIIYGFEHRFSAGAWWTVLYIYRPDQDARGKEVE